MFCHKYNKYTKNRAIKKGDTLIEVTLAVGIFSMVAVAVLAVMNGSASSAQTALEATLTREEIDAQADALRFIHSAYVADKNNQQLAEGKEQKLADIHTNFAQLWSEIISPEHTVSSANSYPPATCDEIYNDNALVSQKAFVLNTRLLGTVNSSEFNVNNIYTPAKETDNKLVSATTYPRLVYDDDDSLTANFAQSTLKAAEGIYIVPVPEQVSGGATPSYYDFYIRSCWYGIGDRDSAPSTISTVMRLYNPDAIKPTITETCGSDVNYIMVDTNMRVNGTLYQKGVDGINIDFEHTPKNGDQEITTADHNKCLNTYSTMSPGLYSKGPDKGILFDASLQNSASSCNPLQRLKAKTGEEGNEPPNFALDNANSYKGGDFWYPVHVGDEIDIVVKSGTHHLYWNSNDDLNPKICMQDGVTCNFCKVENPSDSCGGNAINYKYEGIENVIKDENPPNRVEIHFTVNGCAINDTAKFFDGANEVTIDSTSINTNWTENST